MTADDWNRRSVWESALANGYEWRTADLEVLGDFTDQTLEGELADEELGGPADQHWTRRGGVVAHFWYRLISRRATVPGLYLCGFLTPPVVGCLRAALVATGLSARDRGRMGRRLTLLPGGFTTGRLSCGLLGSRHCNEFGLGVGRVGVGESD
jgi:hypothetical protein